MASVAKRADGRWRARYRDAAGKEHARHFPRKVDAQRWLDEVTASVVTGQYVDPRAGRVTLEEYALSWAASQPWRPKTQKRVDGDLRVHVLPALGSRPMADIRPSEVQGLVKALSRRLAPGTVKVIYSTVRAVFRSAVLDRLIVTSPCVRIALPSPGRKTLTIPSVTTVRALSAELPAYWRAVPIVAAGLGLRPGEVFGLQVQDVDFLRRAVTVDRQLDEERRLVELKTPSSYRTVPLPQVVADELAQHLAVGGRREREGLVFPGHDGRPTRLNSFTVAWRRVTERLGQGGLRLHDMRHCYASALIAAGESVKTVQVRMGHASAMVTLDVYGHLWPDSEERTRAAVDAWLAPPADSVRTAEASPQVSGGVGHYLEKA